MTHPDDDPRLDDLLRAAAGGAAPLTAGPAATRARAQRTQRRQRLAGGALALALVAAGASAALALPDGGRQALVPAGQVPSAAPSTSPAPSTSAAPSPSAAESATAEPSAGAAPSATSTAAPSPAPASSPSRAPSATPVAARLQLSGDDLGVTRSGASKQQAVAAVTDVLGAGEEGVSSCIDGFTDVVWDDLRLAFDRDGRLNGWVVTTPRLTTPAGVRVGTTVAQLRRTYGDRLNLFPANPDGPESYQVDGVDMIGALTGAGDEDRVTDLRHGSCTGP